MTSATLFTAPRPVRRGDRRRWLSGGLAVALHLAILAMFLGSHPPTTVGEGVGAGAMDISLAGFSKGASTFRNQTPPAAPASPDKPSPPAPAHPLNPRTVVQIVSDILAIPLAENAVTPQPLVAAASPALARAAVPASGSPGAACDIGGAVQTALRSDPDAHGAVVLIPRDERTAANAVLVWNGQWINPVGASGAPGFNAIRASIYRIVAAAQPDCSAREIVGPRFMLIPDNDTTMVVVVGNASWRWSDLLLGPQVASQPESADRT